MSTVEDGGTSSLTNDETSKQFLLHLLIPVETTRLRCKFFQFGVYKADVLPMSTFIRELAATRHLHVSSSKYNADQCYA
jgi:hypothetical protein